ncbi:ATP-binding protein [Flavobacterium difficile]|uniref:histidine kinase n=1 Tax=Flavobacterium difficile TaxID=2709659 RepID=A0ABX0I6V7_9FLAO|nr:ATP-binding protein [Flavobacterium difficile]NHM02910.1 PAS domain S-box protein [Flavobacterium difficile]
MSKSEINKGLLFNQDHFNLLIKLYKSSFLDYNGIEDIYKTITETAVKGLKIIRASYWEIEGEDLVCKDLYDATAKTHTIEKKLIAEYLPVYFQALKDGIAIVADDVNSNFYIRELKENYITPLGIKNMLDIPIRKDGKLIGVFCCEHNKENGVWTETDLAFARVLCDILNLMIEQGKRRELEKELLETERKISLITENSSDGFVVIENKKVTFASSSYYKLLGYSENEVLNFTIEDVFNNIHKDDLNKTKDFIYENLGLKNKYFKYQFRLKGKSKKYFWREDSACVIYDDNGNYTKYLIISRDISAIKLAEEKATKLVALSKNLNAKLANFTHIVSHNIRSNTSNISMLIDLIEDTDEYAEKKEYFQLLKQNNNKLSETISHLNETIDLQFTSKKRKTEINVKKEIASILETYKNDIKTNNISVEVTVAADLILNTIPTYFESIVSNLISNAIKYKSLHKKPFIKIKALKEKRKTVIFVEDNGIGIDLMKNKDKIFGMYKTFHNNSDAVGLGLFMIKNKIEVLGGTISLESKLGKGTIFKIIL